MGPAGPVQPLLGLFRDSPIQPNLIRKKKKKKKKKTQTQIQINQQSYQFVEVQNFTTNPIP